MANYRGAVRFPDGKLMFFSYQGTTDIARRALFNSIAAVEHEQSYLSFDKNAPDEEEVEVIPYFDHGSDEPIFLSCAPRSLMLITGPTSRDEAQANQRSDLY